MAKFFTLGAGGKVPKSTAAMKLRDAGQHDGGGKPLGAGADGKVLTQGQAELAKDAPEKRALGRQIFLDNCAICHSSKQPAGFDLRFEREMAGGWDKAAVPDKAGRGIYTLPMEYGRWTEYKKSPAYQHYRAQISQLAGPAPAADGEDAFIKDNFLSNELRVPVTLVGTYAGRALATNAMRGQVWDNYSSETFKNLPTVGKIRFFNPYLTDPAEAEADPMYGTNDEFDDGRDKGGPGYFRPASLISTWATAPYLHNNALGLYNRDPSVKGRMAAFEDGIRKLLWQKERAGYSRDGYTYVPPGDLRAERSAAARNDPGYIYRLPVDTHVTFQPGFIRPLVESLFVGYVGTSLGRALFTVLSFWSWVILTLIFIVLIFRGRGRHAGILLLILAVLLGAALAVTGAGGMGGSLLGALMMGMTELFGYASIWLWLGVVALAAVGVLLLLSHREWPRLVRAIFIVGALVTLFSGILANKFLNGRLKDVPISRAILPNSWLNAGYKGIHLGPIPRGTPVNLVMNMDPEKRAKVGPALVGLLRALARIKKEGLTGEQAYQVLAADAGPALIAASKCPDFVLDRGHYFGETLTEDPKLNDEAKEALIAFLKTL
jgi:mono/diheme cytochrome c family protein